MLASNAAGMVNRFLSGDGEDVVISRIVDATTNPPTTVFATCRAFVRDYRPEELMGGIVLGDSKVSLGGAALAKLMQVQPPGGVLMNVPRKNDKIVVRGRQRNIEGVAPIAIGGQIVRIDLLVRG
jgi:hypothetical protein